MFEQGRQKFDSEIKIIDILKELRYLKHFIINRFQQLPQEERNELRDKIQNSLFQKLGTELKQNAVRQVLNKVRTGKMMNDMRSMTLDEMGNFSHPFNSAKANSIELSTGVRSRQEE